MTRWHRAYIGIGTNLGDRREYLRQGLLRLHQPKEIRITRISSVYETQPVGGVEQPEFLNMVVEVNTTLPPESLLSVMLEVEKALHRVRDVRWGPRTLDLDLLLYEDQVLATERLTLPHPRMTERGFVIIPLREVAGDKRIPAYGKTVEELVDQAHFTEEVRKTAIHFDRDSLFASGSYKGGDGR